MARVVLENVTKAFDSTVAVRDVSLTVSDGQFVTLLGPSGCGKTTTLRMIAGFIEPTSGKVVIGDRIVSSPADGIFASPEQRGIGMVFQSYAVWPHMTVIDNVAYPLKFRRMPKHERHRIAEKALGLVHLDGMGHRYPHQLSGGQQQRVALARALVSEPKVMLLDEPLSNLDAKLREEMRFEIKDLQKRTGVTIVYVTHDQGEAMAMSDRIAVMHDGVIRQIGTPGEVYENPADQWVADFIGLTNLLPCLIDSGSTVRLEDGLDTRVSCRTPQGLTGKAILSVRPENIKLSQEGDGAEATIVRTTYLGSATDYRLALGHLSVRVQVVGRGRFRDGDKVKVGFEGAICFSV
jgi:iron(III) transport system ATP-binding protein